MSKFQNIVRAQQAAAIPGTLVQAADTYKYVRNGVTEDATCEVGWFVTRNKSNGLYHKSKAGDTNVDGIVLLDSYITSDNVSNKTLPTGSDIRIVENGVVAVELPSGTVISAGATSVVFDTATGDISIRDSYSATETFKYTGWNVVQNNEGLPGIAFLKK